MFIKQLSWVLVGCLFAAQGSLADSKVRVVSGNAISDALGVGNSEVALLKDTPQIDGRYAPKSIKSVDLDIRFASGQYVIESLDADSKRQLQEVAAGLCRYSTEGTCDSLMQTNAKIEIQGHTDSDGSDAFNLELSQKRAEAIQAWLVNEIHVDASRLQIKGFGESCLVKDEVGREIKERSRRTTLIRVINNQNSVCSN